MTPANCSPSICQSFCLLSSVSTDTELSTGLPISSKLRSENAFCSASAQCSTAYAAEDHLVFVLLPVSCIRLGLSGPILRFELPVVPVAAGRLVLNSKAKKDLFQPSHWLVCLLHQVLEVPEILRSNRYKFGPKCKANPSHPTFYWIVSGWQRNLLSQASGV